jgi:hypothetical protein
MEHLSMTRSLFALAALFVTTSSALAAPTVYTFDSVSRIDLGLPANSLTGLLQGQSTPTTVIWNEGSSGDDSSHMSRCVPILLTMLEKPGRYRLNLYIDSALPYRGMITCGLELRN